MPLSQKHFWRYAVLANLIVSGMVIWGALQGSGSFVVMAGFINWALLQTFMAVVTIPALVLAATVLERQRAEDKLRATLERDLLLAEIEKANSAVFGSKSNSQYDS